MFLKDDPTEVPGFELNKASNPDFLHIRNIEGDNPFAIMASMQWKGGTLVSEVRVFSKKKAISKIMGYVQL